jgi:GTP-binding protein
MPSTDKKLTPEKIRNIAIVAHIDHGKTTLVDALLTQSNLFREGEQLAERMMDSYDQERERGITIFAKQTSVYYGETKINIIDTPGHADFAGEVERILGMVSTVLLIVDAVEGPMPQTRFVLSKSLAMGLCPIVVVNKIDRPGADPHNALDLTFDLFTELGATDEQLDFSYCFASAISGYAKKEIEDESDTLRPLFDLICEKVEHPGGEVDGPFLMQACTLAYDDFVGRKAMGRILRGTIKKGDSILHLNKAGERQRIAVTKLEGRVGLAHVELEEAVCGDIVSMAGAPNVTIGDTLCSADQVEQLPPIEMERPTVSLEVTINTSPFVGREGKHLTMNKLRERLEYEKRANITLGITESTGKTESYMVAGRGELQLSVLIEAMRREGFECSLSKPQVITRMEAGKKQEPFERVHVEVPSEYSGTIIEDLAQRKGEMQSLHTDEHNITKMEFIIPTRGLMGYRNDFLTRTRGLGVLTSIFEKYDGLAGAMPSRKNGVLVSQCTGKANAYGCFNLQDRGSLFVQGGDEVYEGMVVGSHNRDNDLVVNVTKAKQLTNVRASGTDEALTCTPPRVFTLESAIDFIEDDELVEVTPASIRIRKRLLGENDRKRYKRSGS